MLFNLCVGHFFLITIIICNFVISVFWSRARTDPLCNVPSIRLMMSVPMLRCFPFVCSCLSLSRNEALFVCVGFWTVLAGTLRAGCGSSTFYGGAGGGWTGWLRSIDTRSCWSVMMAWLRLPLMSRNGLGMWGCWSAAVIVLMAAVKVLVEDRTGRECLRKNRTLLETRMRWDLGM